MATTTVTELQVRNYAGEAFFAIKGDADNGGYYWDVQNEEGTWLDSFWAGPYDSELALLKQTVENF